MIIDEDYSNSVEKDASQKREENGNTVKKTVPTTRQSYQREKVRLSQLGKGFDAALIISFILTAACYIMFAIQTFSATNIDNQTVFGFLMFACPLAVFAISHTVSDLIYEVRSYDIEPEGYTRNLSLITGAAFAAINIILYLVCYITLSANFFLIMIFAGGVISFTFVSQYMWRSVVREIFTCGGFTFKLPGFIFSLTVDSIIWMIVTKILLGFLSILVFIVSTIAVALFAMASSVITFIPCFIYKTIKDKNA